MVPRRTRERIEDAIARGELAPALNPSLQPVLLGSAPDDDLAIEPETPFIERYNAYLLSPEWHRRRVLVLQRDGHLCQGCRSNPATQVHHLTYSRVFNEMLFDLISICRECHEAIHPHMRRAAS